MFKIGKKEGYEIGYDADRRLFCVQDQDGNEVATGATQEIVEAQITMIAKQAFKLPIPAIKVGYSGVARGRITSVNAQRGTAYFSYDDKRQASSTKVALQYDHDLYEVTEANENTALLIDEGYKRKGELEEEIKRLKAQFEKPIDMQYFGLAR